jgi:hypothetical protein
MAKIGSGPEPLHSVAVGWPILNFTGVMKMRGFVMIILLVVIAALVGGYFIDIEQTEEGSMPEVSVESGKMPDFDVTTGSVEVEKKTVKIPVPDVNIVEKEVTVPSVKIKLPSENQGAEQTQTR